MASQGEPNMKEWFEEKLKKVNQALSDVALETAKEGAEITRLHISTRGTQKSGKLGRIETGEMLKAVKHSKRKAGDGRYTAEFGWIKGTPEYAKFQEEGFTHVGGGEVAGMYALSDAAEYVEKELESNLNRRLRGI